MLIYQHARCATINNKTGKSDVIVNTMLYNSAALPCHQGLTWSLTSVGANVCEAVYVFKDVVQLLVND